MSQSLELVVRLVFTLGGKGGVGKTELILALVAWYRANGITPLLIDFDIENTDTNRSGLKSFYPEAIRIDLHEEGALNRFFDVADMDGVEVVLADFPPGAGKETFGWFDDVYAYTQELKFRFTGVGVATNDAGAVQSVLSWASCLQDRVDYLVVLNEMRERKSPFPFWHKSPEVKEFVEAFEPKVMTMDSRLARFQAELRNHTVTLDQVIKGQTKVSFFEKMRNVVAARSAQDKLFKAFDEAAEILLP